MRCQLENGQQKITFYYCGHLIHCLKSVRSYPGLELHL
jgi:hypothetical protein